MPTIHDFLARARGTPVIGCYLSPRVLLGSPDFNDPMWHLRIGWRVEAEGLEVLVTFSAGLFVEPPRELAETETTKTGVLEQKETFEQVAAMAMNMVV